MRHLMEEIAENLILSEQIVEAFRIQNFHKALRKLGVWSNQFISLVGDLTKAAQELFNMGYSLSPEYVSSVLVDVLKAQEEEDYILTADLMELQIIPMLMEIQKVLVSGVPMDVDENRFYRNKEGFRKRQFRIFENHNSFKVSDEILVEPTSSGLFTLKMTDTSGSYYFHSNTNPYLEGTKWARQYYDSTMDHYVVVGLGLGYHIKALLDMDDGVTIDIYEPDGAVIETACRYMDLSWLYGNDRVRLIWDEHFKLFSSLVTEDVRILIHYPSLRHIRNEQVKLYFQKFFIRDSGKRNFEIQFHNNFRDNLVNCDGYVDELASEFAGKNAVIVAAGPSLDKNVDLLRERPDNTIIVAVGTVFRKLVNMGIRPDYVVFLDAQASMISQIEGLEQKDIPIICGATAYKGISKAYQGKKYLVCQNGYDRAESYATTRGYKTYETGGSVSTIALDICVQLGCRKIGYIGLDLAFTENRGHSEASGDRKISTEEIKYYIPAIGGGVVGTSNLFIIYREWIEGYVKKHQLESRVYDATEGGALKEGLTTITLKELFGRWEE